MSYVSRGSRLTIGLYIYGLRLKNYIYITRRQYDYQLPQMHLASIRRTHVNSIIAGEGIGPAEVVRNERYFLRRSNSDLSPVSPKVVSNQMDNVTHE